jgi:SAM-dependent methyltransferase
VFFPGQKIILCEQQKAPAPAQTLGWMMYNQIVDVYSEIFPLNLEFLAFLQDYLGQPGSGVLDLGCGPGEYVDYLSRQGYRAVGIDSSTVMIGKAQAKLQGDFHPYSFQEISSLSGEFFCIFSTGNSISYLSPDERIQLFQEASKLHQERGNFVIQVINWDRFLSSGRRDFPEKVLSGGRTFHRRYEKTEDLEVLFHTELRDGDQILGSWSDPLYPVPSQQLEAELEQSGYVVRGLYGDYVKSPFDQGSSDALILTAERL